MKFVDSKSPLGSEFDRFLFAPLGEDGNGLPLSVVSLLARIDLDPWQEAGDLAALPVEAAARRLACSLDTLMDPVLRKGNTETAVLRLLALLPRAAVPGVVRTPLTGLSCAAGPAPRGRIGVIILITSVIVLLGSQFIGGRPDTSSQPQVAHGPAILMAPAQTPPPNPGHKG